MTLTNTQHIYSQDLVPHLPPFCFTAEQYHQIVQADILDHNKHYELIIGVIYEMSPVGPYHAYTVMELSDRLRACLGNQAKVSTQNPISLSDSTEPLPDIILLKPPATRYKDRLPKVEDILLLIEVADSSLNYDRTSKVPLYAEKGIFEYWIVNLKRVQLEVYRYPDNEEKRYREFHTFDKGKQVAPLAFSECEVDWWS